ncbi:hypothetical protein D9M70_458360 [compost metagenome]
MAVAEKAVGHDDLNALRLELAGQLLVEIRGEQTVGRCQVRIDIGTRQNGQIRHKLAELAIVGGAEQARAAHDHFIDLLLRAELVAGHDGDRDAAARTFTDTLGIGLHGFDDRLVGIHLRGREPQAVFLRMSDAAKRQGSHGCGQNKGLH